MTGLELDDATAWQWWCQLSDEQAVPPYIEDPGLVAKLIALAFAGTEGQGGGGDGPY
jgi:hypothetical protein